MKWAKEKRGEKIAGSRFYRDFCVRCGEAMRVDLPEDGVKFYCRECSPGKAQDRYHVITPRQRAKLSMTRA